MLHVQALEHRQGLPRIESSYCACIARCIMLVFPGLGEQQHLLDWD